MKSAKLIQMVMILLEKKKSTARELSGLLNVSQRTIYRYINTLANADIPIYSEKGKFGGIYIRSDYSVDNKLFTNSDLEAMLISLKTLEETTQDENYLLTVQKIKKLIPNSKVDSLNLKANQILIDTTTWDGVYNSKSYIKDIKFALDRSLLLEISYENSDGIASVREIEPYRLILKGTYWYLQAYCKKNESLRLFKLSRIANLLIKDIAFTPRFIDFDSTPVTSWNDEKGCIVSLNIDIAIKDDIASFYGNSVLTKIDDKLYNACIPFSKKQHEYRYLMGLADKCEVIEPLDVRNELIKLIKKTLSLYK